MERPRTHLAIVGCGFVADYYLATLPMHPELHVTGLVDRLPDRAALLSRVYGFPVYRNLEELLADPKVQIVLNLTNPREHHAVTLAALSAGKHVYSEKPLAMETSCAADLVALAKSSDLLLAAAPCSLLGETAQTLWRAVRRGAVGPVRLVYAEMEDGMIPRMPFRKWKSASGLPWPYKDEFEVGCTLEHAGYFLTWLVAMFGPVTEVTTFASTRLPDKVPGEPLSVDSPDLTVACLQHDSGVVSRLTCGIVAPRDHALTIVGDGGILTTGECWDYRSPVHKRRSLTVRRRTFLCPLPEPQRLPASPHPRTRGAPSMDFARGPAEMAAALREGRPCRLSADLSLHVTDVALAIHHARRDGAVRRITTRFPPIEPMPWAR